MTSDSDMLLSTKAQQKETVASKHSKLVKMQKEKNIKTENRIVNIAFSYEEQNAENFLD